MRTAGVAVHRIASAPEVLPRDQHFGCVSGAPGSFGTTSAKKDTRWTQTFISIPTGAPRDRQRQFQYFGKKTEVAGVRYRAWCIVLLKCRGDKVMGVV